MRRCGSRASNPSPRFREGGGGAAGPQPDPGRPGPDRVSGKTRSASSSRINGDGAERASAPSSEAGRQRGQDRRQKPSKEDHKSLELQKPCLMAWNCASVWSQQRLGRATRWMAVKQYLCRGALLTHRDRCSLFPLRTRGARPGTITGLTLCPASRSWRPSHSRCMPSASR